MTAFTFKDKNILVIEDQRPFLILLKGLLATLGAKKVTTCLNAEKAISHCRKNSFDIVISDLHLGNKRKNGFELIEELRVQKWLKPQSVFLLISADSDRHMVMGSIERRPDDFLIKPFSQAQLKSRTVRAWDKRQFLAPIFLAIEKGQLQQAINTTVNLLKENTLHTHHCLKILIELYWRTQQNQSVMQILNKDPRADSVLWMQIAKAKTELMLKHYDKAVHTASAIIKKNRFCVEAFDVLAEAQLAQRNSEEALATIQDALKISPFSLERQFIACRIARDSGDYKLASQTCLAIWEQSKRSVHQSSSHWCGYVRSLLDAAENATDKKQRNSYQQEVMLAMQRSRFDDVLPRFNDDFNIAIFEDLVNARINVIDGKLIDAKRLIAQSQFSIEKHYESYPLVYMPDSIHTLLKIGEFEQAKPLLAIVNDNKTTLDPNSVYAIQKAKSETNEKQNSYAEFNKQGIKLYQEGKFLKAKEVFESAQKVAPVNTGVALNLLQCLLKIIMQTTKKKIDKVHVTECRKIYRIIDGMPLVGQHLEKFEALRDELMDIIK